jgi:hypothetical protein
MFLEDPDAFQRDCLVTVRGTIHVAEASAERRLLVAVGNAGDEQRRRQLIALRRELND